LQRAWRNSGHAFKIRTGLQNMFPPSPHPPLPQVICVTGAASCISGPSTVAHISVGRCGFV
jgi:hypothetical protein